MKNIKKFVATIIATTTLCSLNAQVVTEHINTCNNTYASTDRDDAIYLSDGAGLVLGGGRVSKIGATGQTVLFAKNYEAPGLFQPEHAIDVNGTILLLEYGKVIAIDIIGNVLWANKYSSNFQSICESHNGEAIGVSFFQNSGAVILELVEFSTYNGDIIDKQRRILNLPVPNYGSFVWDIKKVNQGYFCSVGTNLGENYTVSLDHNMNIINVMKQELSTFSSTLDLEIRSLLPTKGDEMYFLGYVEGGTYRRVVCGKIDFNHNIVYNKMLEPANGEGDPTLELGGNNARIVETPNKVPYYDGNITVIPTNNAVTFAVELSYNTYVYPQRQIALFQFDEVFSHFNYSVKLNFGEEVDMPGIIERSNRIELFVQKWDNTTLLDYKLPEDLMTGCYASNLSVNETSLSPIQNMIDFDLSEEEFFKTELDFTHNTLNTLSNQMCRAEGRLAFSEEGVEKKSLIEDKIMVDVYPNPSTGNVTIKTGYPSNSAVNIYDVYGKLIESKLFQKQVELSDIPKGFYLVKITNGMKTYTEKLIIK